MDAIFGVVRIPLDGLAVLAALLCAYQLRAANIDLVPGFQLLEPASTLPPLAYYVPAFVLPGIAVYIVLAACNGLYTLRSTLSAWIEMGRIALTVIFWFTIVIAWFFLVLKQLFFSRILLVHSAVFMTLFLVLARAALLFLQRSLLRLGYGRLIVVSVGSQEIVRLARETLLHDYHYLYVGHLSDLTALQHIAPGQPLDLVLQTDPNPGSDQTIQLIEYCRAHHIGYGFLPPVLADVPHLLQVERLGLLPLIRFRPTPLDGWGRIWKRAFDVVVSMVALMLLSPFLLLIALATLADSGWPVFYVSRRVGQNGRRVIPVLKFRSMTADADTRKQQLAELNHRRDGPLFKIKNDPRVTRVGKTLRRFSLDELPQLLSVITGHMSLVGPRPHLPEEVERYNPEQCRVFAVKPGITGLAQVSGRSDLTFEEEVRLDLQYVEEWSIRLDLWILWRTVFIVMSREGAD
ncbi:MAG: undecaprenyl-phosphate galactose phosphotransferase [Candidatus Peribacteria bacterium]|nr:undecaprenyl-phosphate galactose phosphotransferase [Candidatus Peribacteria bacterium]